MKRIAIFCDGTWNHADDETPTNVKQLHRLLADRDADGVDQIAFYLPGVGARKDKATGLAALIDRIGGGAFGWGLTANIEAFYRMLTDVYVPGDQVYIFGFSRGAYTARSLAGLIRNCGIPDAQTRGSIPEAMRVYRERDTRTAPDLPSPPDRPRSLRFREDFSPHIATSALDLQQRQRPGACHLYRTAYLGIWDTVGALGVPAHFTRLARLFNGKYRFHDTNLSSSVAHARHAIAIDETRRTFPPVPWGNLDVLNGRFPPAVLGDPLRYQEMWFPGVHGTVGGGGDLRGLSDATLYWVAKGAERTGLRFRPELEDAVARIDPASAVIGTSEAPGPLSWLLSLDAKARTELTTVRDVSRLARRRVFLQPVPPDWAGRNLPTTLAPVLPDIRALGDPGADLDL